MGSFINDVARMFRRIFEMLHLLENQHRFRENAPRGSTVMSYFIVVFRFVSISSDLSSRVYDYDL